MVTSVKLREERDAILADDGLRGASFGAALAGVIDDALARAFGAATDGVRLPPVALVALGSWARRELCPGSDIDVVLLVGGRRKEVGGDAVRQLAEQLWYPLWDAGFVTGHGIRSIDQSLQLADTDIDAFTTLLTVRHVAGDASLTEDLERRARDLARRRRDRLVRALADASQRRRAKPGPVAEMLEPDLKEGAGGLRDIHALTWAGHALGEPGGLATLAARGFLTDDDVARLTAAEQLLLDLRVTLQRVTGSRSDRLVLQDQDNVAKRFGAPNADDLVRTLSTAGREVVWIVRDAWTRLVDLCKGPSGRVAHHDRLLAEHVVLRDGRVTLVGPSDGPVRAFDVLEAAAAAAEADAPFDRATLVRLREMSAPTWDVWERAAFLRLLRAGERAIPVFEALDHEGVLTRLLPEWELVRSLPQRNAYHRFTVDRHSLEVVAECVHLLDLADATPPEFDGVIARGCRRPELLLLGGLLHDIGKGLPGDHADTGARMASDFGGRIHLDSEGREILPWLVHDHLLLADTAMRRDLSDERVIDGIAAACVGDGERLRLLYLLTIADSRATGPAAWGTTKAALLRDLFVKTAASIDRGAAAALANDRRAALAERLGDDVAAAFLARMPSAYVMAFDVETMMRHHALLTDEPVPVTCEVGPDGRVVATVLTSDRAGLLATLAGALTCAGLTVLEANLFSTTDGLALDVFRASDPFERIERHGAARVSELLSAALAGDLDVAAGVASRVRDYRRPGRPPGPVEVVIDLDASAMSTVVEVHADDEVGLLYNLAAAFNTLAVDVRVAKVSTMADRVVDVFYVRDARGEKITDPEALDAIRRALVERITGDAGADGP